MNMVRVLRGFVLCGALAYAGTAAWASEPPLALSPASSTTWIWTVSANLQFSPLYPGSDRLSAFGFPSVSWRRPGEPIRFWAPDDSFSLPLFDTGTVRVGIAGAYLGERSASDDWRLIGLEPIKWAVEVGAFIDFWPAEFLRTRLELRRGVRGHDGFVAALGADAVHRLGPFTLSVGPRLKFADERFTQTYFGVRPHESAANGFLPPYRTGAGVAAVGALASLGYAWSQDWSTMVYASYYNLVGDAAASPIVRRIGSTDQFGFGASFSYSYGVDMARSAAAGYSNSMMDPGEPRWGIALLGGASAGEDRLVNLLGNPWIARFREDFFGGVAASRRIGRWLEHFMVDIEAGAGYRHGRTNAPEGWVAAYLRFDGFPWSQIVYTTVGVSTGVNYIARLPAVELGTIGRPEPSTSKLLHYFSPEITFSHPAYRSHELLIRYHHRSGVFGLFGGVWGGSNVIATGYRNRF